MKNKTSLIVVLGVLATVGSSIAAQAEELLTSATYACQATTSLGRKSLCMNAPFTLKLEPMGFVRSAGLAYLPEECGAFYEGTQLSVDYNQADDQTEVLLKVLGRPNSRPLGQTRTLTNSAPGNQIEASFDSPAYGLLREKHVSIRCVQVEADITPTSR